MDRGSEAKKKALGMLEALKGSHDQRLRMIRGQINGVKPFHMVNMSNPSYFFIFMKWFKERMHPTVEIGTQEDLQLRTISNPKLVRTKVAIPDCKKWYGLF